MEPGRISFAGQRFERWETRLCAERMLASLYPMTMQFEAADAGLYV